MSSSSVCKISTKISMFVEELYFRQSSQNNQEERMYNVKPGALKKGQGGLEEKKGGNKRADGW